MNDFRTALTPRSSTFPLNLKDKIFTIGSCFADEIGSHLIEDKFAVSNNPFGTVYNPVSIHQLLYYSLFNIFPSKDGYSQNGDIYFHYNFHSSFSSLNADELKKKIKHSITSSNLFLENSNYLIMTYGTAFVYFLTRQDVVVANCHKMPSSNFKKMLLTEEQVVRSFKEFYQQLKSELPSIKIILTVSPVRHLKDTLELNSVSKSILRTACHTITDRFKDVEYFPAYEIMLDDLRDYRFYKTDRLHPTEEAVEYIWKKFNEAYFDESTKKFVSEWEKVKSDINHKSFHQLSETHQKFLKILLNKLEALNATIDVSNEIQNVKNQINRAVRTQ
jgi:hypothetical protein